MPKSRLAVATAAALVAGGLGLLSALSGAAASTDGAFVVDHWGTGREALPQSSVIAILQARDGYLWLGTLNGLVRFDGVRFTVFDENNTPGLESSRIVFLFEDSRTNLWVGTETAGCALVTDGRVRHLGIGRGSREGRLVAACEDAGGCVWLYTADGQLCRYDAGQVDVWSYGAGQPSLCRTLAAEPERLWVGMDWQLIAIGPLAAVKPPELPRELVLPVTKLDLLLQSARGGYWRLGGGRIVKCRGNTLERELATYPWRATARPAAACEDPEGNLIVGTLDETGGDGVFWFDAQGRAARIGRADGLSRDGILALCMDREGDLWVGTDGGGLNRVRRRPFQRLPGTEDWVVQSVCADAAGGLWVGANGGQVGRWRDGRLEGGQVGRWRYGRLELFPTDGEPAGPSVRSVFVDRRQRVWLGTWGRGLLQLMGERFRPVPAPPAVRGVVLALHEDRHGTLWVGTRDGLARYDTRGWEVFTRSNGLSADTVRAIADDAAGNLWVGTEDAGLNRLRADGITVFRKGDEALPSDRITALLVDQAGVLWVGTAGGLARFDGQRWTRYTTRDGLASNSISYLLEAGDGDLWLGSNAGLMRLRKDALNALASGAPGGLACRAYEAADGLPTSECTVGSQPAAGRTADGRLWFPTIAGLVSVHPAALRSNLVAPPVVIESVHLEGRLQGTNTLRAPPPSAVTIAPGRQRLEIRFTSLNLAAPDRTRFQYRLAGYETDWTDAANRRVAPYPRLAPGRYTFEVRACNEDGVWSARPATLAVTVLPPFWRTWWFVTLAALALLGAVAGSVHLVSTQRLRRQLRQQQALERERARIARDLHDQLGANLTQVALLGELVESDKDDPQAVEAHARQITHTSRDTTRALDEIVWATNPANDTLESLVSYVCKYAQDYFALAGLRYRLEVPDALPAVPLPPEVRHDVFLAAKEAVHNVVKHAQATCAWVRLRLDAAHFTLEIQDDGRGPGPGVHTTSRSGVKNMRQRLEQMGGRFAILPAPERGTLVRLTVPLRTPAAAPRPAA